MLKVDVDVVEVTSLVMDECIRGPEHFMENCFRVVFANSLRKRLKSWE